MEAAGLSLELAQDSCDRLMPSYSRAKNSGTQILGSEKERQYNYVWGFCENILTSIFKDFWFLIENMHCLTINNLLARHSAVCLGVV